MKKHKAFFYLMLTGILAQAQPKFNLTMQGFNLRPKYSMRDFFGRDHGVEINGLYRLGKEPVYTGFSWAHIRFPTVTNLLQYTVNGFNVNANMDVKPVLNNYNLMIRAEAIDSKNRSGLVAYAEASAGLTQLNNQFAIYTLRPESVTTTTTYTTTTNNPNGDNCVPYDPMQPTITTTYTNTETNTTWIRENEVRRNFNTKTWNVYLGTGFQFGLFSLSGLDADSDVELGGMFIHFSVGALYVHKLQFLDISNSDMSMAYDCRDHSSQKVYSVEFINKNTQEIHSHPTAYIQTRSLLALQLSTGITINF